MRRFIPTWRSAPLVLLGALLAGALSAWARPAGRLEQALVTAALAGTASALVALCLLARQRRLLDELRRRAGAVRANPAPNVLTWAEGGPPPPELAAVLAEFDAVAACYRKALDRAQEARDLLEGDGEAPDRREQPWTPTHFVVGSSRHRMVVRLARNLHVLGATRPLLQLLGRALPDLVARSFLELVHPEDAPALRASLKAALADGEGHDVRFRVFSPPQDGAPGPRADERRLQMDVMVCPDENGAPSHLRCHLLDVTDRVRTERQLVRTTREAVEANARLRQANDELQRLKESYRDLYHQAPVLYFSLDGRGRFVAINETMLRVLGYPREALLNQPYARLLPGGAEGKSPATGALQRPGEVEARWVKQDGTVIDVWVGTTTLQDEEGNFLRSRSAALDVTEQRRLAGAVRGKAEELERANGQLRLINQELEEFTYVVSHDLKEPLRTLEAFSNFLAQDYGSTLGAEGKDYISHLIQASRRLGALIDDLLTLSRAGRVLNTPRPFACDEAVDVALGDLRDLIARKQASVRVEGPLPELSGDPERVIQLVSNLVANALKYNRSEVPEVVLGVLAPGRSHPETNGAARPFCTLFVRDNGVGIDPAYHDQVFRLFRRLHRRDEVDGTGAGLTICKKIVEAHGGRIWVESQVGQGATFFFTLPAAVGPQLPGPLSRFNGHGERAQADALVV